MKSMKRNFRFGISMATILMVVFLIGCAQEPAWKSVNEKVIKDNDVPTHTRDDIPETGIVSNLVPGQRTNISELPDVMLAPGVTCKMYWGKGNLVNIMTLDPGAEIPRETLPGERLLLVKKGSVDQLINGEFITMQQYNTVTNWSSTPHMDFVYMQKGAENAIKAGSDGAEVIEVYWPVRLDYMEKAGGIVPANPVVGSYNNAPTMPANVVMNYYDVQYTTLSHWFEKDDGADKQKSNIARLIAGIGFQCSFLSSEPERVSPLHTHPEEQIAIVFRNNVEFTAMDKTFMLNEGDIVYLPENMVHKGSYDNKGMDGLDVFWPPRPDFTEKMNQQLAKYHSLIPEDAKVELVLNGEVDEPALNFTEGPVWLNGMLYFSNMWFAADFSAASPAKSNTIRQNRDGSFTIVSKNRQTNGLMALGNGNLAVCDMLGHKVIEMNPNNGQQIRVLASEYNGIALDGPNDLVIDAKGGIYITDPQFTPGLEKTQPGKAVYYRKPNGDIIMIAAPGDFGQPNGILLSPDGKTLYVNNTRNWPVGNYLAAYDVNEDGSVGPQRLLAKLIVPPEMLQAESVATGADGMTIDAHGNIYIATSIGLQIFAPDGSYIGTVHTPIRPVSAAFGGDDFQTIFMTCNTRVYKIHTNVKGLEYPLK